MLRLLLILCVGAVLTGCPDVDKYAKDASLDAPDVNVNTDLGVTPDASTSADLGAPDEDAEALDSSVATDAGMSADQGTTSNDVGTEADGSIPADAALTGDAGFVIPETCEVTFQVELPEQSPDGPIHLAGTGFGLADWEPGLEALQLERNGAQAVLVRELPHLGRVDYKYTRGSWDTVETTAECGDIEDRASVVDCLGNDLTINDRVLGWADRCN